MARIGVFICWCGENIARSVDCERAAREVAELPGVVCALSYKYMCSDPGQTLCARTSPPNGWTPWWCLLLAHMHLRPFRKAAQRQGLNPYLVGWPTFANTAPGCTTT